jgi:hypothetical protein
MSYDATLSVQMQVHLHRVNNLAIGTRATAPGESPSFKSTPAEDTRWVGVLPQKEMNGGSGAKRRAALAVESREMAEESSQ